MKKITFLIFIVFVFFCNNAFAGSAEAEAEANVNYAPTFEANDKRGGWGPGSAHSAHGRLPGNFAGVPQTHEPLQIERFMKTFKYEWSVQDVHNFLKEDDVKNVEIESRSVNLLNSANRLKIVFPQVRPRGEMVTEVGTIKGRSLKKNTSSEAVLGMIFKEALDMGGNVVVPLNEGAGRVLGASGWAVSVGYTHVKIGSGEQNAGVGGVGVGYAEGQSSYRHDPFARFAVFNVSSDIYPDLAIFPQKKQAKQKASKPKTRKSEGVDPMILEHNRMLQKKLKFTEEKANYYKYKGKK